jgi:hypothetical protein
MGTKCTRAEVRLSQQDVGGGGGNWTSKNAKKQNRTLENPVSEWSKMENNQEKGGCEHGVPVRESEGRNTHNSLGNEYIHMCVCVNK